jgi:hypothetical protein
VEEVVLTGQGGRSDAARASAAAVDPAAAATAAAGPLATADASPATATTAAHGASVGVGARPEAPAAGTAQAPARARAPRWANLPYAIVLAVAAGGLSWVALGGLRHVQAGMITVATALLAAAVLRLVLPERAAGLLVTRHRLFDVLALASLGAGIMAAVPVLPAS